MFSPQIDLAIRFITLALYIYWQFYWIVTEPVSDKEKAKKKNSSFAWFLRKFIHTLAGLILILQLFGLPLLPLILMPEYLFILQLLGCLLVISGVSLAVSARKTLGANWAHAFEYQIKERHELVTKDSYKFIRHPIYVGLFLGLIGAELVVGSYLFLIAIPLLILAYVQAKREEKILLQHFGDSYKNYLKRSKMFIPFLW